MRASSAAKCILPFSLLFSRSAMEFLRKADLAEWLWAHTSSPTQVFARLHSFPSGLPNDKTTHAKERALLEEASVPTVQCTTTPQLRHVEIRVKRGGVVSLLPWTRVVVGDVVLFEAGDCVWADLRLLEVAASKGSLVVHPPDSLKEPLCIRRLSAETEPEGSDFYLARNMVWAGSLVMRGGGTGVVVHTLRDTLSQTFSGNAMYSIWNCFSGQGGITSKGKVHVRRHWEQHSLWLRDLASDFKVTRSFLFKQLVIHCRSPLLVCRGDSDEPSVDHVLLGKELEQPPLSKEDGLMGEVLTCCALVSSSWLVLDKIKDWSAGAIALADVTAEGKTDAVGTALLRFALSRLRAKQFWKARQAGFKLFADGGKTTLAQLSKVAFFRCAGLEEAREACSHYATVEGGKSIANSSFWAALRVRMQELHSQHLRTVLLCERDGEWDVSTPLKGGVFLAVVVFAEQSQTSEELTAALSLIKNEVGMQVVLRGDNEDEVIALAKRLKTLPEDFKPHLHVLRDEENVNGVDFLQQQAKSPVWVLKRAQDALRQSITIPLKDAAEGEEEWTYELKPDVGLLPWWQGLVPVGGPEFTLFGPGALQAAIDVHGAHHSIYVGCRGDQPLGRMSTLSSKLWASVPAGPIVYVLDQEDDFLTQCVPWPSKTRTVATADMCSASKAAASIILTNNSLLLLAQALLRMKRVKKVDDIERDESDAANVSLSVTSSRERSAEDSAKIENNNNNDNNTDNNQQT